MTVDIRTHTDSVPERAFRFAGGIGHMQCLSPVCNRSRIVNLVFKETERNQRESGFVIAESGAPEPAFNVIVAIFARSGPACVVNEQGEVAVAESRRTVAVRNGVFRGTGQLHNAVSLF